eukprot:c7047_g1_i1 orf=149-310(+)
MQTYYIHCCTLAERRIWWVPHLIRTSSYVKLSFVQLMGLNAEIVLVVESLELW